MICPVCGKPMFEVFFGKDQMYPVYRCMECDILVVDKEELATK